MLYILCGMRKLSILFPDLQYSHPSPCWNLSWIVFKKKLCGCHVTRHTTNTPLTTSCQHLVCVKCTIVIDSSRILPQIELTTSVHVFPSTFITCRTCASSLQTNKQIPLWSFLERLTNEVKQQAWSTGELVYGVGRWYFAGQFCSRLISNLAQSID